LTKKKATQNDVDKAIIAGIKKTEFLAKYLSSRFRLTNASVPHEMKF
jgi:large subunit ribosomal protein L6e